jgi:CheY-like chemotaxis protein
MPLLSPPKRILTVEDNAIVSADMRAILEGAGYDVLPDARDGLQAVEHMREYAPDLILLDLIGPDLDGVDAAGRIREESDVPILVITGHNDADLLARATAAGTSGHVLKPFSEHGLLAAVRSRLADRDADDFHLRCLIDELVRSGASERQIMRTLSVASASDGAPGRDHGPLDGLLREGRRLKAFVASRLRRKA